MSLSLDKNDITARINKISSIEELEKLRIEYIGKKGFLSNEKTYWQFTIDNSQSDNFAIVAL